MGKKSKNRLDLKLRVEKRMLIPELIGKQAIDGDLQKLASSPHKIMNVLSIRYGLASCRNVVTDICCGLLGLLYFVVSLVDGLLA